MLGLWLGVLGLVMWYFGENYPALFRWLSLGVAAAGCAVLAAVALRRIGSGFIQFDQDVLTVANRTAHVAIPWHNIAEVLEGELHGNPLLLIALGDPTDIRIEPQGAAQKVCKSISRTQEMYGSQFAILTSYYGIELSVLAAAIRRYARDPHARAGLEPAKKISRHE